MYKLICKQCGSEFEHYNKTTKFCTRNCYYKSRKGVKRPLHSKKIKQIMLNKNLSYKNTERAKKIGIANQGVPLSKELMNTIIEGSKKYYYVTNEEVLIDHLGINLNRSGLYTNVKDIIKKYGEFSKKNIFFPLYVQRFPYNKMLGIVEDCKFLPRNKVQEKYNITENDFFRIIQKHDIKNYIYKEIKIGLQTIPERKVEELLKNLKIDYAKEKYIKWRKYRSDFIIKNKFIIEVNGDYWHGNARIYSKEDLNDIQISKIKIDEEKKKYSIDHGFIFVEIWEMDIYKKIDKIKEFFIKLKKGELDENKEYFNSEFF